MPCSEVGSVLSSESNTGMIPDFLVVLGTYSILYHDRQNAVAGGKIRHWIYKHNKIKYFMQEDNICNAFIINVFPCNFSKQNGIWKRSSWFLLWFLCISSAVVKSWNISQSFSSPIQWEKQHCINILFYFFSRFLFLCQIFRRKNTSKQQAVYSVFDISAAITV